MDIQQKQLIILKPSNGNFYINYSWYIKPVQGKMHKKIVNIYKKPRVFYKYGITTYLWNFMSTTQGRLFDKYTLTFQETFWLYTFVFITHLLKILSNGKGSLQQCNYLGI